MSKTSGRLSEIKIIRITSVIWRHMNKIKILVEGITPNLGGLESYIMTQYKCINDSIFHYDFIFSQKEEKFPENYKHEIDKRGGKIFYIRNRKAWDNFLSSHDYDFFISNTLYLWGYIYTELNRYHTCFKHIIIHSHIARKYPFKGINRISHEFGSLLEKRLSGLQIIRWACSDVAGRYLFGEKYDYEKENDAGRPCGTLRHILPRG